MPFACASRTVCVPSFSSLYQELRVCCLHVPVELSMYLYSVPYVEVCMCLKSCVCGCVCVLAACSSRAERVSPFSFLC
jgi:hypothetical protein